MTRVLRAELLKLRTGPMVLLPLLAAVPSVLITVDVSNFVGPQGPLLSATDLPRLVNAPGVVVTFLALVAGVLFATGEWRHHTAIDTFLREPRRGRVVLGKLLAAVLGGTLIALAGVLVSSAVGWKLITDIGVTPQLNAEYAKVVASEIAAGALYAGFGAALGLLLRSQAAALVVALTWRTGLESLLVVKLGLKSLADWMPHAVGMTIENAGRGPTEIGLAAAVAVFAAYVVAFGAAATLRTVRGDVA